MNVSVVIPLYNKRDFIAETVHSVLNQTHAEFELIVIDDGSTDGGAAALATITDHRLRIIRQSNVGVAKARNRGLAEASSDWIALLDADDRWAPDHLASTVEIIQAYPDAGIVAMSVQEAFDRKHVFPSQTGPLEPRKIDYFAEAAANILVVHTSATTLRRAAALEIGGFRDLRPGQDIDCWARIALDWPVATSHRRTVIYQRETGGAMEIWRKFKRSRFDIASLHDFGGAVDSLASALKTGRYEEKRQSIEQFIDARIVSGAGRCLASGDMLNARNRLGFVHHQTYRSALFRTLSHLPAGAMPTIRLAYRRIRQLLGSR